MVTLNKCIDILILIDRISSSTKKEGCILEINIDELTQDFLSHIKKVRHQVVNLNDVSASLREKLGTEYTSEIGIAVKNNLKEHEGLDFFREGNCLDDQKYHFCVGNWLATKGLYSNGVQAKSKIGLLSWQRFEDDWEDA